MSLRYFPHQAINGAWHAVYRTPGCNSLTSMGEAGTEEGAKRLADELNRQQQRDQKALDNMNALRGARH